MGPSTWHRKFQASSAQRSGASLRTPTVTSSEPSIPMGPGQRAAQQQRAQHSKQPHGSPGWPLGVSPQFVCTSGLTLQRSLPLWRLCKTEGLEDSKMTKSSSIIQCLPSAEREL